MKKLAFLGAGNMAFAIVKGLIGADITVYDKITSQYDKFDESVKRATSVTEAVKNADCIFLAVKPQNFPELLGELKESGISFDEKTFVSIAAGISCESICRNIGRDVAVIRTMPNTPLMIGKGVTALSRNGLVGDAVFEEIVSTFALLGKTMILPENKMNAVIAATSSAPAYVYHFIDAICKEARAEGVDAPELLTAVCAMVSGSAEMLMSTGKAPEELIKMVTSPKGTTERAMNVLCEEGFADTVARAMRACTERAEELSKNY